MKIPFITRLSGEEKFLSNRNSGGFRLCLYYVVILNVGCYKRGLK